MPDYKEAPTKSLWDQLGEQERDRRVKEFIEQEIAEEDASYGETPRVDDPTLGWDARPPCVKCGLGKDRQHPSTAKEDGQYTRTVEIHEQDGELVLLTGWLHPRFHYFGESPRPNYTYRLPVREYVTVKCECGNLVGRFRPNDSEWTWSGDEG